jgi:hypothetical protein
MICLLAAAGARASHPRLVFGGATVAQGTPRWTAELPRLIPAVRWLPSYRRRLVPNTAYNPSDASRVYKPACGDKPAKLAYAIISGINRPQMVNPAIESLASPGLRS